MANDVDLGEMAEEDVTTASSTPDLEPITLENIEDLASDPVPEALSNDFSQDYSPDSLVEPKMTTCTTCHRRVNAMLLIDGECPLCAMRRMRKIDEHLGALKQLKPSHTYCMLGGHRLASDNKLFPEWNGELNINGVKLYPVQPLCSQCIDEITAYLVRALEQRGILRKGMNHLDNAFGAPYKIKLTPREMLEARSRLQAFLSEISIEVLDKETATNRVFNEIRSTRKVLLKNKVKEMKAKKDKDKKESETKWQESLKSFKESSRSPKRKLGVREEDEQLAWMTIHNLAKLSIPNLKLEAGDDPLEKLSWQREMLVWNLERVYQSPLNAEFVEGVLKELASLYGRSPYLLSWTTSVPK